MVALVVGLVMVFICHVYYERKVVEVHQAGQPVQIIDIEGILDGGGVLPGFKLAVKDIFRD